MLPEILIIFSLILLNGIFAMSELAIVSARKSRLQQIAKQGKRGAALALNLAESPNQFLSTIQIGITLIGIIAGAYGGATLAEEFAVYLSQFSLIAPHQEAVAFIVVVGIITYLSLIIGELVPKRIALNHAEFIAVTTAPIMKTLSVITAPLVWVLTKSIDTVLALLRIRPKDTDPVTEEELNIMVEEGTAAGVVEPSERDMITRVLQLGDTTVTTAMTPRADLVWYDISRPKEENWKRIVKSGHSFFPVCEGSLDNIIGIGSVKELWFQYIQEGKKDIRPTLSTPLILPHSLPILDTLEHMKSARKHFGLVVDEHGTLKGVVTLMDMLEAIVGLVPSLGKYHESPPILKRADDSWLVDGGISIAEFKRHLDIEAPLPLEQEQIYQTLAGFIISFVGHIPKLGDQFTWNEYQFEIIDTDNRRIDKILVRKTIPSKESSIID